MAERIFSQLTKNLITDTGQGPVLGAGETKDFDISLAGFSGPYTVLVQPQGTGGTVTREIMGLGKDGVTLQIIAPAGAALNAISQDDIVGESWSRIRVRLVAGTPAPDGRTLVQVNGAAR